MGGNTVSRPQFTLVPVFSTPPSPRLVPVFSFPSPAHDGGLGTLDFLLGVSLPGVGTWEYPSHRPPSRPSSRPQPLDTPDPNTGNEVEEGEWLKEGGRTPVLGERMPYVRLAPRFLRRGPSQDTEELATRPVRGPGPTPEEYGGRVTGPVFSVFVVLFSGVISE